MPAQADDAVRRLQEHVVRLSHRRVLSESEPWKGPHEEAMQFVTLEDHVAGFLDSHARFVAAFDVYTLFAGAVETVPAELLQPAAVHKLADEVTAMAHLAARIFLGAAAHFEKRGYLLSRIDELRELQADAEWMLRVDAGEDVPGEMMTALTEAHQAIQRDELQEADGFLLPEEP